MIIVSGADSAFYNLLHDLIMSIRQDETGKNVFIGVFDLGLESSHINWLEKHVNKIIKPDWDINVPESLKQKKELLSLTARPFLPKYFPGFEVYIWIDADAWVQQFRGVDYYYKAANIAELAVAAHIDRSYRTKTETWKWRYDRLKLSFGKQAAQICLSYPYVNAGVIAARGNSKIWRKWGIALQDGVKRGGIICDQSALNYSIWINKVDTEILPSLCNWQCHLALPKWDREKKMFCEPYFPYTPLGLIHLTWDTKTQEYDIKIIQGGTMRTQLRYRNLSG
ncbi:MAG: hypothetical protein AMJ60_07260 [Desulfobacterales bacterium SG8_35]|nr:MAG: hypothetical protein AMJ60_07260 [Desulfobacterales bacterium SG8_35]